MPSNEWINESPYPENHVSTKSTRRAKGTVKRIMDKPFDIHIHRDGDFLPVQTVRIEGRGLTLPQGTRDATNSVTQIRSVTVFGVRGHPRLPDLDIQVNDRFGYNGSTYIVTGVTLHAGEIQAAADRYQP